MSCGTAWSRCCRGVSAASGNPGRKALPDREVLCGILYVLHTGIQWEYLPKDPGLRLGHDLLATAAGLERGRRVATAPRGPASADVAQEGRLGEGTTRRAGGRCGHADGPPRQERRGGP